MKKLVCVVLVIMLTAVIMPVKTKAEGAGGDMELYFEPLPMEDNGDVRVNVHLRNFAGGYIKGYDGIAIMSFTITFDEEQFTLKNTGDGYTSLIDYGLVTEDGNLTADYQKGSGKLTVSFLDMTLEKGLISREGPVCSFVITSKRPQRFYHSFDFYPLTFVPGSISASLYKTDNGAVADVENIAGLNSLVGGYTNNSNILPVQYSVSGAYTYILGSNDFWFWGEKIDMDVAPYIDGKSGEVMLPIRYMAEKAGWKMSWDEQDWQLELYVNYRSAIINAKTGKCFINAKPVTTAARPVLINGRMFIPASLAELIFGISPQIDGDFINLHNYEK